MNQDLLPVATYRKTFAFLGRMTRANLRSNVIAALMIVLASATGLVSPWVLGSIVDEIRAGRDTILSSALIIAVATVAAAVFGGLSVAALARAGEPALAELRESVLVRALHLPADRIEKATTGDLLSRLSDDMRTVSDGLRDVIPIILSSAVTVVFTAGGVLALDWRLGLAMLTATPLYVLALRWFLPRSERLYRQQRIAQGERAEALLTGVHAATTSRAFGIGGTLHRHIDETSDRTAHVSISVYRLTLRFLNRNNVAELFGLGMVLAFGFFLVRNGLTTIGAVTAASLYFVRLFTPIGGVLFTFDQFQAIGSALVRLVGIATMPAAPGAAPGTGPGEVVLTGISHEYVSGKPVLRNVDLRIAVGERVALVGVTGAGKTTLGAIAAGVLHPTQGTVTTAGVPFDPERTGAGSGIFLVTQDVHVFAGTVREALTLVKPEATEQEVRAALAVTKADRWVVELPDGLDTVIGDQGRQLRQDQVQQLAVTRILLRNPWFVVLDEATAEAGSMGALILEKAAEAALQGRTALVVAHRLAQARMADRILVMHDGAIAEQGTHDELLALDGRYAELWRAWSDRYVRG
ncbi:ABC transporter ATP-binding protein [[Kitasatospora] papulosa]|uniref:ABC transporter ATP-binding protein n=1 Tax=[Kitasatospora] papulosa TaxID=1464011 RepID=UPI002E2F1C72|nr:ABC transporter ATP-binding protein [[Kitasatospora] papulosa]